MFKNCFCFYYCNRPIVMATVSNDGTGGSPGWTIANVTISDTLTRVKYHFDGCRLGKGELRRLVEKDAQLAPNGSPSSRKPPPEPRKDVLKRESAEDTHALSRSRSGSAR